MTAAPDGRRMLRLEIRNTETPIERKPPWIKTIARQGPEYLELQKLVKDEGLHTVCQEAGCRRPGDRFGRASRVKGGIRQVRRWLRSMGSPSLIAGFQSR